MTAPTTSAAPSQSWMLRGRSPWPLQPNERVMRPDGTRLEAWEFYLLRSLSGGSGE